MLSSNHHALPTTPAENPSRPRLIGFRIGMLYSSPLLLVILFFVFLEIRHARITGQGTGDVWVILPLALLALEIVFSGVFWGGSVSVFRMPKIFLFVSAN